MVRIGRDQGLLGISIGERSMLVAEVRQHAESGPIARVAELSFPAEVTFDNEAPIGSALAHFLQWHGFMARRVVFGVPAKWLIPRPYVMPPADLETTSGVLWLHSTEVIPAELGSMAIDYDGECSLTDSSNLLLLGLQQRWMDRLSAIAKAVKLKIIAVTPSASAIAAATAAQANPALVLSLHMGNAELMVQSGGHARSLRHIGPAANTPAILAELRRASAANSMHGGSLVLWDDANAGAAFIETLRGAINIPVVLADRQWVDVSGEVQTGLPAIALTLAERNGKTPGVDFLHPKLKAPRQKNPRRRAYWIASTAAAIVLAVLICLGNLAELEAQVADADSQLQLLQPAVAKAQSFVANTEYAATFQPKSPRCLACIRDLTVALGEDSKIYFTNFDLRMQDRPTSGNRTILVNEMKGQVFGRSDSSQSVLDLLDKLSGEKRFADLNCRLDPPRKAASGNEVSFILTFGYIPE